VRPFDFQSPTSLTDALALLERDRGAVDPIAGGQSLLLALKARQVAPRRLVNLMAIPELAGIRVAGDHLWIGPTVTYAELAEAPEVDAVHGFLARVVANIADRAVRTMATLGGAICQADPAFDVPVLMTAVDASFELSAAGSRRRVAAADFFCGPSATARAPQELLTGIFVPLRSPDWHWGFAKQGMRVHDAALASVVLGLQLGAGDEVAAGAVVVVGGAVGAPRHAPETERWCRGHALDELASELGARVAAEIEPDVASPRFPTSYRRRLVPGLSRRALRHVSESRAD
jgi:CO/xanthine dehydrogenase FAD-binding subunit